MIPPEKILISDRATIDDGHFLAIITEGIFFFHNYLLMFFIISRENIRGGIFGAD